MASGTSMSTATVQQLGGGNGQQQPLQPPAGPGGPGDPPGGLGKPGGPGGPPGGPNGGGAGGAGNGDENHDQNQNNEVDFDLQDGIDAPRALEASGKISIEINLEDINFWFGEIESEMLLAGVQSQWLKFSVLRKNLPVKQREDVKSLLRLKKSEAGPTPYFDVKIALIKIYALRPKDSYKKALGRVLTGLPSQQGNK